MLRPSDVAAVVLGKSSLDVAAAAANDRVVESVAVGTKACDGMTLVFFMAAAGGGRRTAGAVPAATPESAWWWWRVIPTTVLLLLTDTSTRWTARYTTSKEKSTKNFHSIHKPVALFFDKNGNDTKFRSTLQNSNCQHQIIIKMFTKAAKTGFSTFTLFEMEYLGILCCSIYVYMYKMCFY